MDVELRHLRALVAVVDEGTFTAAAVRLHTGQPAVSRTLAQFERLLGVRLLERSTREVTPTGAGRRTYRAAVAALRAVDAVVDVARDARRPLRFGYSWAALGRFTPLVLQQWRRRHPETPLEARRIDTRDAGLRRGLVDAAVIRGPYAEPGVATVEVLRETRVAAVPSTHPLAACSRATLDDLAGEVLVFTPSVGTTTASLWPRDRRPSRTRVAHNVDEWLTTIAAGDGVGVSTTASAASYPVPGVTYLPLVGVPDVPVLLAWPEVAPHPAVPDLVRLVQETVAGRAE